VQPDIVYIDNHLVIAVKPRGLRAQPDFEEVIRTWLIRRHATRFFHLVHRLDTPTGGLIVGARTKKALSRVTAAIRERRFKKRYTARLEGQLSPTRGLLIDTLSHGDRIAHIDPAGKEARLSYEQRGELTSIELETGRYHQIRAQFAAIGHPVVGDVKYGAAPWEREGIALMQTELEFDHPTRLVRLLCHIPYNDAL
jgi:23S rRNA pseudouridine1911/1915/1917 synthase